MTKRLAAVALAGAAVVTGLSSAPAAAATGGPCHTDPLACIAVAPICYPIGHTWLCVP